MPISPRKSPNHVLKITMICIKPWDKMCFKHVPKHPWYTSNHVPLPSRYASTMCQNIQDMPQACAKMSMICLNHVPWPWRCESTISPNMCQNMSQACTNISKICLKHIPLSQTCTKITKICIKAYAQKNASNHVPKYLRCTTRIFHALSMCQTIQDMPQIICQHNVPNTSSMCHKLQDISFKIYRITYIFIM
jgi:hypothetical protein